MKSKNLILGLVALTFAVGSAFASMSLAIQDAYIEVQFEQNGDWECVDSGKDCDSPNGFACNISVSTTASGGTEIVRGKPEGCPSLLTHTTATAQAATLGTVYDAR